MRSVAHSSVTILDVRRRSAHYNRRLSASFTHTIFFSHRRSPLVATRWLWCAFLCAALRAAPLVAQTEQPISTRHVLLLHQAGELGTFRGKFDIAFEQALRSTATNPIEMYEEAIDAQRFAGSDQSGLVKEYLRVKYAGRSIDVIVAQGIGAVLFARENRALFGDPPIVARVSPLGQMSGPEKITGLQGGDWVKGTIDLGMALLPDTRNVVVIDGAQENNPALQADIERQMQERHDGLTLIYLRDLPLNEVISRVAAAPPHSIVLFVKQTKLDDLQNVDQFAALAKIAETSRVPIFSYLDQFLGHGVVGGYMWRVEDDARRMADMARRIATGTPVAEIPPDRASYEVLIDWRQLQRWQIPEARVPSGSVVLFRQPTLFEQNWRYVGGSLLIFLAQFGLILALLIHRSRRRLAEEESRTSKERYRSVVDTQSEFIRRFLPDTTLTFVNDAYCRFRGATRDELLGTKFIDVIPEPVRDDLRGRLKHLTSGVDTMEYPVKLPDGTIGWHHWTNHPICDDRGRIVEFQGVGRDITEQRRAQEALVQAEARNSAMLRAVPDLMFVLLRDGTYVDYHARDAKLLFAPPSVFIGKKVRDIMPPRLAEVMMEAIEGACARADTVVVEYDLPLDDIRYFEARIVRAGADRVLSMVRDVTDAKRANALNRDLAGRLISSQEAERRRIARELHDDVSQKVALLNIGIDEVTRQVAAGEARARLQQLSKFTKEVAGDLRDLSHELHGSRLQSLGLVAAIEVLCRDTSKQIGVTVPFAHGVLPQDVDPNVSLCLYRIAQEALNNIARHSHARHAQVTLICENRTLTLQIADSGVGFDPHSARQSGLGLISMRDRVAFLRGQLAIHAAPGGGTRIGVNLPIGPPADGVSSVVSRSA
jgi:PAS domain S-box-containing protein